MAPCREWKCVLRQTVQRNFFTGVFFCPNPRSVVHVVASSRRVPYCGAVEHRWQPPGGTRSTSIRVFVLCPDDFSFNGRRHFYKLLCIGSTTSKLASVSSWRPASDRVVKESHCGQCSIKDGGDGEHEWMNEVVQYRIVRILLYRSSSREKAVLVEHTYWSKTGKTAPDSWIQVETMWMWLSPSGSLLNLFIISESLCKGSEWITTHNDS